jgi:hypothetical protein
LKVRDVAGVNVPRLPQFNATQLYNFAVMDDVLKTFLPDPTAKGARSVGRKFLFDVSDTGDFTNVVVGD